MGFACGGEAGAGADAGGIGTAFAWTGGAPGGPAAKGAGIGLGGAIDPGGPWSGLDFVVPGAAGWPGPALGAERGNTLIDGNGPFGVAGFFASVPLLKGPELDRVSLILSHRYRRNAPKFREAHYDLAIETDKLRQLLASIALS